MTLNGVNGSYFALFHRIRVRCRRKTILGLYLGLKIYF